MRFPDWMKSARRPAKAARTPPSARRDRIAFFFGLLTLIGACSAALLTKGQHILMPGPLASAHGSIQDCGACHSKSGNGKLSWLHGLIAGDPLADSKACLTCHKMPETAFNAHGADKSVLTKSSEHAISIAALSPPSRSARAQSFAVPMQRVMARDLYCATCHQEHQGVNFTLSKISNEQCRSCHVLKFDSFDGNHPKFEGYPFERRTRLIFDHAGHFDKHYPEVAKKEPAKRIPATCSTCHSSRGDKRIMPVARFEEACSTCHLDQITGKARASGPKGVAFLSLPGLDLAALKKKNAPIGEWPDASEAALTPFMEIMISRHARGRDLIKAVNGLNLQDLAQANDEQIKAVTDLVWEIKTLFFTLIWGKPSDVLGDLNLGTGAKLSANLVVDLTASMPREVVIGLQQQWLPNLAAEMAQGPGAIDRREADSNTVTSKPARDEPAEAPPSTPAENETRPQSTPESVQDAATADAAEEKNKVKRDPPACLVRFLGQCLVSKTASADAEPKDAAGQSDRAAAPSQTTKKSSPANSLPPAMRAGAFDAATGETRERRRTTGEEKNQIEKLHVAERRPSGDAGKPSDDLLFPTEQERREIDAHNKNAGQSKRPLTPPTGAAPGAHAPSGAAARQPPPQAEMTIESEVDPESWAEYGGWYRQDFAISYRPAGHKDKFIYSWLFLTGPQSPKGGASPAVAVFDYLTGKDAQGACAKCHSVDDIPGKGRLVNFSPLSLESKNGRFTQFVHEPHFGTLEKRAGSEDARGCLTCHDLERGSSRAVAGSAAAMGEEPNADATKPAGSRTTSASVVERQTSASAATAEATAENSLSPYLKSYENGNPRSFASEFTSAKKDLCQKCHTSSMARQDCLLCHKYHVHGVVTPAMSTKLPIQ